MVGVLVLAAMMGGPVADPPVVHRGTANELTVKLPRIDAEPTIDGVLDDGPWAQAPALAGFSQYAPADGRPAEVETTVLVWYSPTALYFGIRAAAEPGSVRATLSSRDRLETDDQIQIYLLPFNDGRQALLFGVNPLGVQMDGALIEGTRSSSGLAGLSTAREAPDLSPDFVYQSKGRLTATGYEIEVRIPFKSVRSPSSQTQDWGLQVIRVRKASGAEDTWTPARRAASSFLAQSGTLSGLSGLRRGLVLDLNPITTGRVDGVPGDSGWRYGTPAAEFGGNVRWGITPNLTLNGTVNPDFAEVEADASQFVFDPRQALYYAEKRPFFLDGIEQFSTPNQLIYTRRIVAPLFAAKLNGKIGVTSVAVLSAVDDAEVSATGADHPVYNIARIQRDVGDQSKVALIYTDKIDGDRSNRVAAADTRIVFKNIYTVQAQAALSRTHTPDDTVTAPLWMASVSRNGRRFGFRYQVNAIDEDFRAAAGFLSRVGIARASADHRLAAYGPKGGWWERATANVMVDGYWRYDDFVGGRDAQDKRMHLSGTATLRGGWDVGVTAMVESFGYDEGLFEDYRLGHLQPDGSYLYTPYIGTSHLHNLDWQITVGTPQWKRFSADAFYLWGKDENFFEWSSAGIVFAQYGLDWRPTEQIRVNGGFQLQQYKRRTDRTIVGQRKIPRLKVEYQLSRAVFFRFVGEYDAYRQDDLRDDSRTDLPIFTFDGASDTYSRALGYRTNRFRADWLFSYQPVPGTVVFAGYGSTLSERDALRFRGMARDRDGFFLKLSYLFRM
jgi:hypothetical protein